MQILFLTDNFPPEVNAPASRSYEHCREWVKLGAEVTVITCAPNFPVGKVFKGYKNKPYQQEMIDGIKVIKVWSFISANEGFVKRTLDYLSFALSSFLAGLFVKTDLIIATSPQFFTAVSGASLSFFKRKKWVMEVRDLWPESIVAVGAMKRNWIIRLLEKIELRLYKSADQIIVVTDNFKKQIIVRGINSDKISVIKNGVNLDLFIPTEKPLDLIAKYGLKNKFIIAYIGTHGLAHGLSFVLDNIKPIEESHPYIQFVFLGNGAEKQNLITQARNLELNNVIFLDSVSKNEVVRYLNLIDVALVNLAKSETFKSVIPSKIFEAAAVNKPILLGLEGETKALIEKYGCGLCFEPENGNSFTESVIKIATDESLKMKMEKACERFASDFNRKKLAAEMFSILQKI
jgi:glycosyltransferase involved in cell wall biosynthesis